MSEQFNSIENVFSENTIFEIDAENNVMRGKSFLQAIDQSKKDVLRTMESYLKDAFEREPILLKKIDSTVDNAITYEIKGLIDKDHELAWKNHRFRFRLLIEACEDSPEDTESSTF